MTQSATLVHWATPADIIIPKDELLMSIDIYTSSIIMTSHWEDSKYIRMVSPDDLATALTAKIDLSTGILPPNTLWWKRTAATYTTALWRPPQVWRAALQNEPFQPPLRYMLPMPGLIFICSPNRPPWVYAAKERPIGLSHPLYHAPTFNVFTTGRVCPGTHSFPDDATNVPDSFFQSLFSLTGDTHNRSIKHPNDLKALWDEINAKEEYPLEDLVQAGTLADAESASSQHLLTL